MNTMKTLLLTVIALQTLLTLYLCESFQSSQDYVLTNDEFISRDGDSETLIDFSHLDVIGRERVINGTLIIVKDLYDEDIALTAEVYSSPNGDGNYKKTAFEVSMTKICEAFKKFYKEFLQPSFNDENSNMPYVDDDGLCPIPAGEYYLKNIELNTDTWPNQMPRGTLKAVTTFYKGDDVIGGLTAIVKIEDDTR